MNEEMQAIVKEPIILKRNATIYERVKSTKILLNEAEKDPTYGYVLVNSHDDCAREHFFNGKHVTKGEVYIATVNYNTASSYTGIPNVIGTITRDHPPYPFNYFLVALNPIELMLLYPDVLFPLISTQNKFQIAKVRLYGNVVMSYQYTNNGYVHKVVSSSGLIFEDFYEETYSRVLILDGLDKLTKKQYTFFNAISAYNYYNEKEFYNRYIGRVARKTILEHIEANRRMWNRNIPEAQADQILRSDSVRENKLWDKTPFTADVKHLSIPQILDIIGTGIREFSKDEMVEIAAKLCDDDNFINGLTFNYYNLLNKFTSSSAGESYNEAKDILLSAIFGRIRSMYRKATDGEITPSEYQGVVHGLINIIARDFTEGCLDLTLHELFNEIAFAIAHDPYNMIIGVIVNSIYRVSSSTFYRFLQLAEKLYKEDSTIKEDAMKKLVNYVSRNVCLLSADIVFTWPDYVDYGSIILNGPNPDIIDKKDWITINVPGYTDIKLDQDMFQNFRANRCFADMIPMINTKSLMRDSKLYHLLSKTFWQVAGYEYGTNIPALTKNISSQDFYNGGTFTPTMLMAIRDGLPINDRVIVEKFIEDGKFSMNMLKVIHPDNVSYYNMISYLSGMTNKFYSRYSYYSMYDHTTGVTRYDFFTGTESKVRIKDNVIRYFYINYNFPLTNKINDIPLTKDAMNWVIKFGCDLRFNENNLSYYSEDELVYIATKYKDRITGISRSWYSMLPSKLKKFYEDFIVE